MHSATILALLFLPSSHAIPSLKVDPKVRKAARLGESFFPCLSKYCREPDTKYSVKQPISPRIQWDDAGGYCGSMSIQEVAMGKGVWLSQQQIRDHALPGGGHDSEILATNVEAALKKLKLDYEAFQYKTLPVPQADAYRSFLKKHLVAGHGVFWMIMLEGGKYPVYPGLPYGYYSHVEPVYGFYSNHPLNDTQWYDDDYLAHGTDADLHTYYRRFDSLVADVTASNRSECGGAYTGYPCIYKNYGFGYAIKGPMDLTGATGKPVALSVDNADEPDTRHYEKPVNMKASLLVTELDIGQTYDMWRFNDTESAFVYDGAAPVNTFTASNRSYIWEDPEPILSSSATYYRCLLAAGN